MNASKITFEKLISYAAGDLTGSEAEAVSRHIEADSDARRVVDRFRRVVQTLRSDDTVAPPADVLERVKLLYAERRVAAKPSLIDTVLQIVAELVYDSRPQLALAGVRGAATAYQLSFESDLADVDLEIEPHDGDQSDLRRVAGQVSPRDIANAVRAIAFVAPGTRETASTIKPDGHGAFGATVPCGVYDLMIHVAERTVILPGVEIE